MFYLSTTRCCRGTSFVRNEKSQFELSKLGKVRVGGIVGDATLSISALVIGILALVGVMQGVPPAASYTLLGISGVIILSWIGMACQSKGKVFIGAKNLLKAAFC